MEMTIVTGLKFLTIRSTPLICIGAVVIWDIVLGALVAANVLSHVYIGFQGTGFVFVCVLPLLLALAIGLMAWRRGAFDFPVFWGLVPAIVASVIVGAIFTTNSFPTPNGCSTSKAGCSSQRD